MVQLGTEKGYSMKTAVRMDDITPDMDFEKFNKVKAILDEAHIKPLIGVVPFCKDETLHFDTPHEDFGDFLKSLSERGWIIALHGYNHLYTTKSKGLFPINEFSEFAGVSYEKQEKMIKEGVARLTEWGVTPKVFMAPGHTFDRNTFRALKKHGIERITDGFGTTPYIRDGMIFYPISSRRSECTGDKNGYSTYVLHTNTMSAQEIDEFGKMVRDNREHFISYDEYMDVSPIKRSLPGTVKEYLMALAKHYLVSKRASKGTIIHNGQ